MTTLFHGLSAFPITPASPDGVVEVAALRALLGHLAVSECESIGLLGSTGSYPYLSRGERRRAVEIGAETLNGAKPLLVGIGALRTDEAVALARDARAAGADGGLLAPVSYTPLTEEEVFEHCRIVATESGLPICLYDNPGTTHFTFTPGLIARLSREPGIRAVKTPAPPAEAIAAHLADLRTACAEGFAIGYSVDWQAAAGLVAGADGWYSVLAGILPDLCTPITETLRRGDTAAAEAANERLAPIWDLFRRHTSLRVTYVMAHALGFTTTELPRPLLPLPESAQAEIRAVLRGFDLI